MAQTWSHGVFALSFVSLRREEINHGLRAATVRLEVATTYLEAKVANNPGTRNER